MAGGRIKGLTVEIGGDVKEPSTYFMKHPKVQMEDFQGRQELEDFIRGIK